MERKHFVCKRMRTFHQHLMAEAPLRTVLLISGMGRKPRFTPELQEKFLSHVRAGLPNKDAAQLAGISKRTLYRWLNRGEKVKSGIFAHFWHSFKEAEADFKAANLDRFAKATVITRKLVRQPVRRLQDGSQVPDGPALMETMTETRDTWQGRASRVSCASSR